MSKKPVYKRVWFRLLVIVFILGAIGAIMQNQKKKFDWEEIELSQYLPEPVSDRGIIFNNDSDSLDMHIEKITRKEYTEYIEACKKLGYTIEEEQKGNQYEAFNKDGYGISLGYIGNEILTLEVKAPVKMETLHWPKSEIANVVPQPDASIGKISKDTAEGCYIYVGDTSIDDFHMYADRCSEYGFTVDYERGDKFYYAKDEKGNEVSLTYQGNQVMSIEIEQAEENDEESEEEIEELEKEEPKKEETTEKKPEKEEVKEKEEPKKEQETIQKEELVDGMRPEFKKAMDSYESFMNEYCKFMKKYAKTDGTDLDLLDDYMKYLDQYTTVMEDFDAWDDGEMNTVETAYYLDVQNRIAKKLLEVEGI